MRCVLVVHVEWRLWCWTRPPDPVSCLPAGASENVGRLYWGCALYLQEHQLYFPFLLLNIFKYSNLQGWGAFGYSRDLLFLFLFIIFFVFLIFLFPLFPFFLLLFFFFPFLLLFLFFYFLFFVFLFFHISIFLLFIIFLFFPFFILLFFLFHSLLPPFLLNTHIMPLLNLCHEYRWDLYIKAKPELSDHILWNSEALPCCLTALLIPKLLLDKQSTYKKGKIVCVFFRGWNKIRLCVFQLSKKGSNKCSAADE